MAGDADDLLPIELLWVGRHLATRRLTHTSYRGTACADQGRDSINAHDSEGGLLLSGHTLSESLICLGNLAYHPAERVFDAFPGAEEHDDLEIRIGKTSARTMDMATHAKILPKGSYLRAAAADDLARAVAADQ